MYHYFKPNVDTRKLTWNLKITPLKEKLIFQTFIFRFHVSFRGSISYNSKIRISIPISRSRGSVTWCSRYNISGDQMPLKPTIDPNSSGWWQLKYFLNFHPNPWGNDPKWRAYFSNGLVQPPTSKSCFWRSMFIFSRDTCLENPTLGGIFFGLLAYLLSLSCVASVYFIAHVHPGIQWQWMGPGVARREKNGVVQNGWWLGFFLHQKRMVMMMMMIQVICKVLYITIPGGARLFGISEPSTATPWKILGWITEVIY